VLEQGLKYLTDRHDEMFADESENSPLLDPSTIDWQAVKDGRLTLRFNLVMTNAPGAASYPIAATTFVLMYKQPKNTASSQQARKFFGWALAKGQPQANSLDYVPLPAPLVQRISRYMATNIK
jgi:phosphate transport system substrate-binding protein